MIEIIQFKTDELRTQIKNMDSRLRFIVYSLAGFVAFELHKNIEITEILRTQEQQDFYYKDNPDYKIAPWQSVHQYGRGVDISVKYFTQIEIDAMVEYLNKHVFYGDNVHKTALVHNIGLGNHLHVQTSSNRQTLIENS